MTSIAPFDLWPAKPTPLYWRYLPRWRNDEPHSCQFQQVTPECDFQYRLNLDWKPMLQLRRNCPQEWVDFNNHMRDAYYVLLVSFANDQAMDELGMGPRYLKATGHTLYNVDTRIRYLKEAHGGDALRVDMLLLDADSKRLHLHSTVYNDATGVPLAVNESVLLHVNQLDGPAAATFPNEVAELVAQRLQRDAAFKPQNRVGDVGIRRK